ncbi:MAG: Leucine-rich repeat (LRR) protein [Arenicella sp.]
MRLKGLLSSIPPIIENCPNLRYFQTISDVPFRISSNISKASNLEEIRFENTIITHISDEIQTLDKVKAIYFNNSWLKSIPEAVFKMDALEDLRLDFSWSEEMIQDIIGAKYWPYPELELPTKIPFNSSIEYIDLTDRLISESNLERLQSIYTEDIVEL